MASRRELAKRLVELEGLFPPLSPIPELPIEEWARKFTERHAPSAGMYDEDFFSWYEELGSSLASDLGCHIAETWGVDRFNEDLGLTKDECAEILERAGSILPPYIDEYWRRWQADKPERDRARIAMAEISASVGVWKDFFPNTDTPEMIRRCADALEARPPRERLGKDWLIAYHRKRADLAEKYASWAEEWEAEYAEWKREHTDG